MILCPFNELRRYAAVIPGLEEAIETIETLPNLEPATYPLSCGKVMVQKGTTKPLEGALLEAHAKFLDIQYCLKGGEVMGWAPTGSLTPEGPFDEEKDYGLFSGPALPILVPEGLCYIVYPEDAHAPGKHLDEPNDYTKIVVKLAL